MPYLRPPHKRHLRQRLRIEPDLDQVGALSPVAETGKFSACRGAQFLDIVFYLNEVRGTNNRTLLPIHVTRLDLARLDSREGGA
jgi:hypothetical protein